MLLTLLGILAIILAVQWIIYGISDEELQSIAYKFQRRENNE